MKESLIQKSIIDYLRLKKCFVFKVNNGGVYIKKLNRYMKSPTKGVSDIIGITKNGFFLAIEVKSGYNKPSEEQLEFLKEIRERGGIAIWVNSLDQVIKQLKEHL